MRSFTENEIRKAWYKAAQLLPGMNIERLIAELAADQNFADTSTITVKEIKDAWDRSRALTGPGSVTVDSFLRDIGNHREPGYPYGTVWKDYNGVIWYRVTGKWLRFGQASEHDDDVPKRPLKQMT